MNNKSLMESMVMEKKREQLFQSIQDKMKERNRLHDYKMAMSSSKHVNAQPAFNSSFRERYL